MYLTFLHTYTMCVSCVSETLACFYQTIRRHVPEDSLCHSTRFCITESGNRWDKSAGLFLFSACCCIPFQTLWCLVNGPRLLLLEKVISWLSLSTFLCTELLKYWRFLVCQKWKRNNCREYWSVASYLRGHMVVPSTFSCIQYEASQILHSYNHHLMHYVSFM